MREISDETCKEYGKSVIENSKFYNSDKNAYWIHKQSKKTHRDILREDVDDAIKEAANLIEFERIMMLKGYTFNRPIGSKHPSVMAKGWQRPVRIDGLGGYYSTDKIIGRISKNGNRVPFHGVSDGVRRSKQKYQHTPLLEIDYQLNRVKYMGTLEALLYLVMELLKPTNAPPHYKPPLSPALRQETRKFEQYKKQFKLLHEEKINTVPELESFIGTLSQQISNLEEERSKIDNKRRRANTDEDKEIYKSEIRNISSKIKPLRDKLKIAKATLDCVPRAQELIDIEREMEHKIIYKERNKQR